MSPAACGRGGGSSSYNLRSFVELLRDRYYWRRSNNNNNNKVIINVSSAARVNSSSIACNDNPPSPSPSSSAAATQKGLQLIGCKNWAERLFVGRSSSSSPPPPRYGFSGWVKWVLGTILTVVLPFWKQKWERLKRIEAEAEVVAEQVERVAEMVEQVATVAESVSAESGYGAGGKVKEAALVVERVSKAAAHEAHVAREFLHKVDKLKADFDDLEKMVEEPKPKPKPNLPFSSTL